MSTHFQYGDLIQLMFVLKEENVSVCTLMSASGMVKKAPRLCHSFVIEFILRHFQGKSRRSIMINICTDFQCGNAGRSLLVDIFEHVGKAIFETLQSRIEQETVRDLKGNSSHIMILNRQRVR